MRYQSRARVFGLPLLSVALGPDLVANEGRGIAWGGLTMGIIALGGVALGGIVLGGLAIGVHAQGGVP